MATFFPAQEFNPEYIPKVGLSPFEVSKSSVHSGSQIFGLTDTTNMTGDDLLKHLSGLDPRILENMPQEVIDEINSGNISHVFQTDPSGSQKYLDMTISEREAIEGKGSIYLRTKEGRTARFKLPEISDGDAGWNANKGNSIFMDQTIYDTPENVRSLSAAEELKKNVQRGNRAAETVDERILKSNVVQDVLSGSETLTGAGLGVQGPTPTVTTGPTPGAIPSQPTVTTGPTPGAIPSQPTVTTGPTPGAIPSQPRVTTGPTPGAIPSQPRVTTGETPSTRRIGKPVVSNDTPPPSSTAAGARQIADDVTKSGNATPRPKATIHSNAPTPPRPSSGAPAKVPGKLRSAVDDLSAAVTAGPNGARNLKMLGIAGVLGVAGFGLSRSRGSAQDDNETRRRLEMQRRGIM